jgi:N-acetylglucosamine kinase-like BadF-type ATPase
VVNITAHIESITNPAYLAVDAGGTSTRAVVLEASGHCLGYGRGAGGNPLSSGPAAAAASLEASVNEALRRSGVAARALVSATIAMAGASTHLAPEDPGNREIKAALAACGVTAPLAIESDLHAMFCAGAVDLDGYALVAGTGAAAIRVRDGRVEHVVDGMGWLLGDDGSGFWIGHAVVRAVVAALDGRAPATALTGAVLGELGVSDDAPAIGARAASLHRLVELLYAERPVALARFAPLAFAFPHDLAARAIADAAAEALARTVTAAVDPDVDGPLVLGGSVLLRQDSVATAVEKAWRATGRTGPARRVTEGTAGAAVLALRNGGTLVDEPMFARLNESLDALR